MPTDSTEIWQEGLRIPPIKLYDAGTLREDPRSRAEFLALVRS